MFEDLKEYGKELARRLVTSRLFALSLVFCVMFCTLTVRLFHLQIVNGEQYQEDYIALTERVIRTASTRGNIYDRNGNVLAYNQLAYDVTIQDTGAYRTDREWNGMLYELVSILNEHGETAQTSLELGIDHSGNVVFTSSSEAAKKRFLRDYYGLQSVDELDDEDGEYPSDITARELLELLKEDYGMLEEADPEFKPFYGGEVLKRDLAYHQGTVWAYPLGAYYMAYLKVHGYSSAAKAYVKGQLEVMEGAMREGCIGQLPEIYDGDNPVSSKGCFAQAWSTGEILRVYEELER